MMSYSYPGVFQVVLLHPRNTKGAIHIEPMVQYCVRVSPLNPEDFALPQSTNYHTF